MAFKEIVSQKSTGSEFPRVILGPSVMRFNKAFTSQEPGRNFKVLFDIDTSELAFIATPFGDTNNTWKISEKTRTISARCINKVINYEKLSKKTYFSKVTEINRQKAYVIKLEYQNE